MINSISNEMYYQYQNVGSYKTGTESGAFQTEVTSQAQESDEELQLPPPRPVSEEEYSSSDHMEMMRGGKPAPEMTELSSTSSVDEETLEEYDVDGDGVLSSEEYAAMMEAKKTEAQESETSQSGTSGISGIDSDGDGTISADEYEEMISQMGISNALTSEDFFEQYDVNEDGEISQDEMPEPGSVKPVLDEAAVSSIISTEDEVSSTEDITASTEYQQLIFKTLQAYKHHYESMFDTAEGSLNKSQA